MDEYYKSYRANIHRGTYDLSETATDKYEHARETVARFLSAEPEEIVFTAGSTLASNMLIYSLEGTLHLEKGDEIVTTIMEHHSQSRSSSGISFASADLYSNIFRSQRNMNLIMKKRVN